MSQLKSNTDTINTNLSTAEIVKIDHQRVINFNHQWLQVETSNQLCDPAISGEQDPMNWMLNSSLMLKMLELILERTGDVPTSQTQLLLQGLQLLLQQWDRNYKIQGDDFYQRLTPALKEGLLVDIADKALKKGTYFFKEKELEAAITKYYCNLPPSAKIGDISNFSSRAVLHSIILQHSIFIECRKGIYAFADLSVYKYLVARKITQTKKGQELENNLKTLVSKIAIPHWQEILLMVVEMIDNADYLALLIKLEIDDLLTKEPQLQQLLNWIDKEATAVKNIHKLAAVRAFYVECILNLHGDFTQYLATAAINNFVSSSANSIQHNFQLTEAQQEALLQYYEVNQLLVDCLDNAHYITPSLREEIEATLLVPSKITKEDSIISTRNNW